MSQLFASGGPSIGASASASVLPMSIHWVDLKGLISFRIDWFALHVYKELSRVFSSTTI